MYGYVGLSTDGSFNYDPGGYVGEDSFTYFAHDGFDYSDEPATVSLAVADLKLESVTFNQAHDIRADPPSQVVYDSNHWQDGNLDGVIDQPDEHAWPVAYTRASTLNVSATFELDREWKGDDIWIRATGPDGIVISSLSPAIVAGTSVELLYVSAATAFPDQVRHYDDFDLDWQASSDGGTTWIDVGTSSNDLYLTLDDPAVDPLYHTVVHLGSHNAQGQTTEDGTITDVWNNVFDGNTVTRVDGIPLWYYRSYSTTNVTAEALLTPITASDGSKYGDGHCGAWVELKLDVLRAQGISRENDAVGVHSNQPGGFLVKNWTFDAGGGHSDAAVVSISGVSDRAAFVAKYPYLNIVTGDGRPYDPATNQYSWVHADVEDAAGIVGKGPNPNPASLFEVHALAELEVGGVTKWYDPSYGVIYEGATAEMREADFEGTAVAGFYRRMRATVKESELGVDLNGNGNATDVVPNAMCFFMKTNTSEDEIDSVYGAE